MVAKERAESLPTDPLVALGEYVFTSILAHLPYTTLAAAPRVNKAWRSHSNANKKALWRRQCYQVGVDAKTIGFFSTLEKMMPAGLVAARQEEQYAERPAEKSHMTIREFHELEPGQELGETPMDWKSICRDHVSLDTNWRRGICRNQWIASGEGVDVYTIDEQENRCISISKLNRGEGSTVLDLQSDIPIFNIPHVFNQSTLGFARGFAVIKMQRGEQELQIYRTEKAILRARIFDSDTPAAPLSEEAASSRSWVDFGWRPTNPLPDAATVNIRDPLVPPGALIFHRSINLPSVWHSFTIRLQTDESGRERAFLGMFGSSKFHIFNLEDVEEPTEVFDLTGQTEIQDAEAAQMDFDADHVFVCGRKQMHIYCRKKKHHLLSFPPIQASISDTCAAAYFLDLKDTAAMIPAPLLGDDNRIAEDPPEFILPSPATDPLIGRMTVSGRATTDPECIDVMRKSVGQSTTNDSGAEAWPPAGASYNFMSCEIVGSDLVYATTIGHMLITKNYLSILESPDISTRAELWKNSTISIGVGHPITYLTSRGTRVAATTKNQLFFFDIRDIPTFPLPSDSTQTTDVPNCRINVLLPIHVHNQRVGRPLLHDNHLYFTYKGEGSLGAIRSLAFTDKLEKPEEDEEESDDDGMGFFGNAGMGIFGHHAGYDHNDDGEDDEEEQQDEVPGGSEDENENEAENEDEEEMDVGSEEDEGDEDVPLVDDEEY